MKDRIFREPSSQIAGFTFDEQVVRVFDDMAHRSIPFYDEVQKMIADLVGHYYQDDSRIYDLGCSTGSMMARLMVEYERISEIIGIDNSEAMVKQARSNLAEIKTDVKVDLQCSDLREIELSEASVAIMSYTLQFVRPLYRERVVRRIFEGLKPGGIFILSEKVLEERTHLSRLFVDMYYRFKRERGYSELEISRKRETLENVLIPYKPSELRELLEAAGFGEVGTFFKWNNFASIIAIKTIP